MLKERLSQSCPSRQQPTLCSSQAQHKRLEEAINERCDAGSIYLIELLSCQTFQDVNWICFTALMICQLIIWMIDKKLSGVTILMID